MVDEDGARHRLGAFSPHLTTERLQMRPLFTSDRKALARLVADPRVTWSPYRAPRDATAVDLLLKADAASWARERLGRWALTGEGELVGYAGFSVSPWPTRPDALDLGFRLGANWWGRGLAREAAMAAIAEAYRVDARLDILATYEPSNVRMARLAETLGFRPAFGSVQFGLPVTVAELLPARWRETVREGPALPTGSRLRRRPAPRGGNL